MKVLAAQWRNAKVQTGMDKKEFSLPVQDKQVSIFRLKYDEIQNQLKRTAGMDVLLSGSYHYLAVIKYSNYVRIYIAIVGSRSLCS